MVDPNQARIMDLANVTPGVYPQRAVPASSAVLALNEYGAADLIVSSSRQQHDVQGA